MKAMPEIIIKLGDNIRKYLFVQDRLRIGRAPQNEIHIDNLAVSRLHAVIERHPEGYIIQDHESSNGTFVNGVRIHRVQIVDRDVIQIGKHELFFYDAQSAPAPAPVSPDQDEHTVLVNHEPPPAAELIVTKGRRQGELIKLDAMQVTLGRDADCELRFTDWMISRRHAQILRRGGKYMIFDLGSWRHTTVNGRQVEECPLVDGDVIGLGQSVTLEFHQAVAQEQSTPRRVPRELAPTAPPSAAEADPAVEAQPLQATDFSGLLDLNPQPEPEASLDDSAGPDAEELPPAPAAEAPEQDWLKWSAIPPAQQPQPDDNQDVEQLLEDLAVVSLREAADVTSRSMKDTSPSAVPTPPDDLAGEIAMWEQALANKSPAIRRQAARRLKLLTGKDYDID